MIDIKRIEGLREITFSKEAGLFIGACATMNEIGGNEHVKAHYPYLAEAALSVGSKQVRNRAHLHRQHRQRLAPCATPARRCYAADAVVCITGRDGAREVPIREFITFVRRTVLRPDEIVTGIRVPYVEGLRGIFTKVARRREVDLSTICGTVARVGDEYRLAFGAVAPTPVRLPKTEALLSGKQLRSASTARVQGIPAGSGRRHRQKKPRTTGVRGCKR